MLSTFTKGAYLSQIVYGITKNQHNHITSVISSTKKSSKNGKIFAFAKILTKAKALPKN